jgi:serine-type D-Ala-D-Ala carboxypeptidase
MKNLFLGGIFWMSLLTGVQAQTSADTAALFYQVVEKSIVLLKNEASTIPLRRLDTLRVAYLDMNGERGSTFEQMLSKYTLVERLEVPEGYSAEAAEAWATEQSGSYNLFIVVIRDGSAEEALPAYLQQQFFLTGLLQRSAVVVVSFGTGRSHSYFPKLREARALVHSQAQGPWAESLAAQAIFGAARLEGRLQYDLGTEFRVGDGLQTGGNERLRYSPAALVGMDEQMIRDSVYKIVEEGIRGGAFPGAQVLVARHGHVIFHEAFGYQTYDSTRLVTTEDIYDFASVTKISTGLPVAMKLYGEGKFDLDAPWSRYYPPFRGSNKAQLRYRDILTHQARLMAWIPFWRGTLSGNAYNPWQKGWQATMANAGQFKPRTFSAEAGGKFTVQVTDSMWMHTDYRKKMLRSIRKSPLNEKPGYVYSDLSFILWPEIVPGLVGEAFEPYLKKTFYHPLGAYTLTFNPLRYFGKDRIIPTELDTFFRQTQLHGRVHDEGAAMLGGVSGHAGLFGSANDLAKLMQLYLNGGSYGGEQLIARVALDTFTSCVACGEGNHRGLGFDKPLREYDARRSYTARDAGLSSFGHTGYTGTFAWADPESGLLMIFLSNRVYPTRDNRKISELGIRPRIHQALYEAIVR